MIILDECISSLDTELRDKVIRALRLRAKSANKTVVLVCHDALEGLFDNVVTV
jgi:ABC-type lipoprotein export system ATPase subunit